MKPKGMKSLVQKPMQLKKKTVASLKREEVRMIKGGEDENEKLSALRTCPMAKP